MIKIDWSRAVWRSCCSDFNFDLRHQFVGGVYLNLMPHPLPGSGGGEGEGDINGPFISDHESNERT